MLIIFDLDGTLVTSRRRPGAPTLGPDDFQFLPGVLEKLLELRLAGNNLAVASNQGGVGLGYITFAEAIAKMEAVGDAIGAAAWRMCPYHPEAKDATYKGDGGCRKPLPGMIVEIMDFLAESYLETLFVGDAESDFLAAGAAGVEFRWAQEFFID